MARTKAGAIVLLVIAVMGGGVLLGWVAGRLMRLLVAS
jgi:hypothetical protein